MRGNSVLHHLRAKWATLKHGKLPEALASQTNQISNRKVLIAAGLPAAVLVCWALVASAGDQPYSSQTQTADLQQSAAALEPSSQPGQEQAGGASSSDSSNSSSNSVDIKVDGRQVNVPDSGSYHKTIRRNGSTTIIDVHQSNNSSGGNSSSVNIDTNSSSYTYNDTQQTMEDN
jgi:hypothetical protein